MHSDCDKNNTTAAKRDIADCWVQVTCALAVGFNTPEKNACGECTIKQVTT